MSKLPITFAVVFSLKFLHYLWQQYKKNLSLSASHNTEIVSQHNPSQEDRYYMIFMKF